MYARVVRSIWIRCSPAVLTQYSRLFVSRDRGAVVATWSSVLGGENNTRCFGGRKSNTVDRGDDYNENELGGTGRTYARCLLEAEERKRKSIRSEGENISIPIYGGGPSRTGGRHYASAIGRVGEFRRTPSSARRDWERGHKSRAVRPSHSAVTPLTLALSPESNGQAGIVYTLASASVKWTRYPAVLGAGGRGMVPRRAGAYKSSARRSRIRRARGGKLEVQRGAAE
ncbi:hypothetical protein B0H11DRAFT_1919070 [Mycena galericulata]|nr:hypothetical protein B0H11DRAFT_1919070 [Mycena galericulata]